MGCEYFLPARKSEDDESLADFVRRRFGREALERLVQPLVGGIYTSDPEKLSLRATMPRFLEMERRHGSLIRALRTKVRDADRESSSGARYGLFTTLRGGMSELLDTLALRVREGGDVRVGTRIGQLARMGNGWRVTTDAGDSSEFDAVVLAVPAYRAADLVTPFADDLACQLRQIEYASSAIVVSGHRLADVQHPLDAFGLVIPAIERRKVLAVSFTSRKFPDRAPEGCVQLRTFVGGAMQPEMFALSDEEILQTVRGELRELLGVGGEPDFAIVARYPRAMPQYHVGHLERVAAIEAAAARFAGLALAGNAYHGVGVPDCVQSAETAAQRLYAGQATLHGAAIPPGRVGERS
jgi:oxygen-dependent protoporphyrinogen oxidase